MSDEDPNLDPKIAQDLLDAMERATDEHARRAVRGLVADLDLVLRIHDAEASPLQRNQWAACLLIRHLARKNQT